MKRFYDAVDVAEVGGDGDGRGWQVTLDGRGMRTVGGGHQIVPALTLAEMLAREWAQQGEEIDPRSFRYRDQTDYAIDVVRSDRATTIEKLMGFADTDTLCFRADPEDALYRRQMEIWDPILDRLEGTHGARMARISGVIHRPQPTEALERLRAMLMAQDDFTLAGLYTLASLAASLCIAIAALDGAAQAAPLWDAANLEEEWQAQQWGRDEDAELVRARKRDEFIAAFEWLRALKT